MLDTNLVLATFLLAWCSAHDSTMSPILLHSRTLLLLIFLAVYLLCLSYFSCAIYDITLRLLLYILRLCRIWIQSV